MYKASHKMCDLISHEEDAIQIISRFGLEMGVGEQTIEQVCEAYHVHTPTFLAIVNYKVFHKRVIPDDIDIPTLQRYLSNAHSYFLEFRLPRLRRALIEALIPADPTTKIPGLILRCYDEFVEEIRTHIAHENEGLFDEHEHDDQRITDKLTEIKNLIIKYYPGAHLQSPATNQQPPITNPQSPIPNDASRGIPACIGGMPRDGIRHPVLFPGRTPAQQRPSANDSRSARSGFIHDR